jgi:tape measure domain-containing protein
MATEKITIRVSLQNANAAAREAYRTSKAFDSTAKATQGLNKELERTHHRSFLFNQAMFTARRVLFGFTIGATAAAGALAAIGIKFNATMEQSEIGMRFLLRGMANPIRAAKEEMLDLLKISRETVFDLPHISEAGRRLLGMGFDIQQTNTYLMAMSENMAAMNQPVDTMDRIITAFGQIRARGKLAGQEMLQLVNAQVPVYQILREELGLTGDQLANIADTGVSADRALGALTAGMMRRFGGANKALLNSVAGQWEKFKENTQIIMGAVMMTPFKIIQDNFPGMLVTMDKMTAAMKNQGFFAMIDALDQGANAGGRLNEALRRLHTFGMQLQDFFNNGIGPALMNFGKVMLLALAPLLMVVGGVLQLLSHIPYLHVLITAMILAWTWHKVVLIKNHYWERQNAGMIVKSIRILKARTAALILDATATRNGTYLGAKGYEQILKNNTAMAKSIRFLIAVKVNTIAAARATFVWTLTMLKQLPVLIWSAITNPRKAAKAILVMTKSIWKVIFATKMWSAALALLRGAIYRIPLVGWLLFGLAALVTVLIFVEKKWGILTKAIQFFWEIIKKVFNWIKGSPVFKIFSAIVGGVSKVIGAVGGFLGLGGGGGMPQTNYAMAGGGGGFNQNTTMMPQGANIMPTSAASMDWEATGAGGGINVTVVPQKIVLDGREIAEVVWKHKLDRFARR